MIITEAEGVDWRENPSVNVRDWLVVSADVPTQAWHLSPMTLLHGIEAVIE